MSACLPPSLEAEAWYHEVLIGSLPDVRRSWTAGGKPQVPERYKLRGTSFLARCCMRCTECNSRASIDWDRSSRMRRTRQCESPCDSALRLNEVIFHYRPVQGPLLRRRVIGPPAGTIEGAVAGARPLLRETRRRSADASGCDARTMASGSVGFRAIGVGHRLPAAQPVRFSPGTTRQAEISLATGLLRSSRRQRCTREQPDVIYSTC
jgi:hypothetical protein